MVQIFLSVSYLRNTKSYLQELDLDWFLGSRLDLLSPGILGDGVGAALLNSEVVGSSHDLEESLFSPVRPPGVSADPVLDTIFDSPTDNADIVILISSSSCVVEYSSSVVQELISDGHTTFLVLLIVC